MIDTYNQLSDLVLNMGFSSTTAEYDKDAVDAQISYISKNKDLLSSLSRLKKKKYLLIVCGNRHYRLLLTIKETKEGD